MRLDKMIVTFLNALSIASGIGGARALPSLDNQNQGRGLGKVLDLENRNETTRLSDKTYSHKKLHSKHRNKGNLKHLDEIQDDVSRQPYSAKKFLHKKIKNLIKQEETDFKKLKEGISTESSIEVNQLQTNLQRVQNFCSKFRKLRNDIVIEYGKMTQQKVNLRKHKIKNKKMLKECYKEIKVLSTNKKHIDYLISNCKDMVNQLQESIESKKTHSVSTSKSTMTTSHTEQPTTTSRTKQPTISLQETERILIRSKKLISQFNEKTQEINAFRRQEKELLLLLQNQYRTQFENPRNISDVKADLNEINRNIIPKLESEKFHIQAEIIKEVNHINSLEGQGEISPFEAKKFLNEYNKLNINFAKERNKRDISLKQNLSKKLESIVINNSEKPIAQNTTISMTR
ncbi:hypothetical protein ACJZQ5_000689 [Enterococcus hirae]|uniref:Uncharacterized protein n=2 Tax=Enterococcus hirae TaxID=1354 RepID=I6T0F6_ENTHA|nr:hypothetical protein [Enterococcus hirae]AFM71282.1 hypothetical protein EHR_12065 [Enterococcus hirae ATCC 9790]EMF0501326.1 hypothetical protein [Enterococcus hirae]EOH71375.1 hypothetical protein UAE_01235 [Enterococcus hirae ATCC 9790]EOU07665.1 hypothetical protein I584_00989 [Enterococcus hirae ATCC 9790]MBA5281548.1 hypothetical protein [Enterococcus hirae]